MEDLRRDEICTFVTKSIRDKQYNGVLLFALPSKTLHRMKQILHFDLTSYQGMISSHSIRHIKKRHPNDVMFVCEVMEILQKFSKVKKSITRDSKTGATLISLEFYKIYDEKMVKLVKLRVHRDKKLKLKTLFVED